MSLYIKGLFSPKPGPAFHNLSLLVFHTPQFHSNFHCFILPSSFCPSPQQDTKQTTGKAFILQCCKIGWVHRKMLKKKQNKTPKRKPNPFSQNPWLDSRAERRQDCKAAFTRAGTDTQLHGCRAAKLLPGNSMNHERSLDPPHGYLYAFGQCHSHPYAHSSAKS